MPSFKLNDKTKLSLGKSAGLNYSQLVEMSSDEIDNYLQKRRGKRFRLSLKLGQLTNRGSVYLYLNRLIHEKEIDRKLSKI